jgi:hypothetical protein
MTENTETSSVTPAITELLKYSATVRLKVQQHFRALA